MKNEQELSEQFSKLHQQLGQINTALLEAQQKLERIQHLKLAQLDFTLALSQLEQNKQLEQQLTQLVTQIIANIVLLNDQMNTLYHASCDAFVDFLRSYDFSLGGGIKKLVKISEMSRKVDGDRLSLQQMWHDALALEKNITAPIQATKTLKQPSQQIETINQQINLNIEQIQASWLEIQQILKAIEKIQQQHLQLTDQLKKNAKQLPQALQQELKQQALALQNNKEQLERLLQQQLLQIKANIAGHPACRGLKKISNEIESLEQNYTQLQQNKSGVSKKQE